MTKSSWRLFRKNSSAKTTQSQRLPKNGAKRHSLPQAARRASAVSARQIVLQRAREKFPRAKPRIISDQGSQFVARDFKDFIRFRFWQTTHLLCPPHYPPGNGKLERLHRMLKEQAIRAKTPLSLEAAKRICGDFIDHHNTGRLHSDIGFVTPRDRLENHHVQIFAGRDKKLESARETRRLKRENQPGKAA